MEITFQQSFIDTYKSIINYGPKKIKVDKNFIYIIDKDYKTKLEFIKDIKFGDYRLPNNLAGRDIESHAMFRADDFDDFIVVRKFINGKFVILVF